MECKKVQIQKEPSSNKKVRKAFYNKNLDGNPECPKKLTVEPNDGNVQRPYKLLNARKAKNGMSSGSMNIKTMMDLTPLEMKFVKCFNYNHSTLCSLDCADMLKLKKPFKETVEYFQNPSLNFADVLNSFKRGVDMIDKTFRDASLPGTTFRDESQANVNDNDECIKKLAESGLMNVIDIKETHLIRKSTGGWKNHHYQ